MRWNYRTVVASALAISVLQVGLAGANSGSRDTRSCPRECKVQLEKARAATDKYHDIENAIADGYRFFPGTGSPSGCVESSDGRGAMGEHWVNYTLLSGDEAETVDPERPEILLYFPTDQGRELVALEWYVPVMQDGAPYFDPSNPPDPSKINPAPEIFARSLNGPMGPHDPGTPWHYDLHVWTWLHNPDGLFADYNRDLDCP